MYIVWYSVFFLALAGLAFRVHSGKKLIALTLTGALLLSFVGSPLPARAQVQSGILGSIQAVLGVINGLIQTALVAINSVRIALSNLEQIVVWPQQLINQARGQVLLLVAQYRNLMTSLLHIRLHSATLPASQGFEVLIRDHQVNNFSALSTAYTNNYGAVPLATDASSGDRALTDMDDAMALDSLKVLKASDQASDVEIQAADSIENASAQAAPGSAPFFTASAIVSGISSQALTQRMLAAELRQEAAYLAHRNALLKENANNTNLLRGVLVNLLQHQ
jgi:lipase chaperone LimK